MISPSAPQGRAARLRATVPCAPETERNAGGLRVTKAGTQAPGEERNTSSVRNRGARDGERDASSERPL
jgi:hypothetical protein